MTGKYRWLVLYFIVEPRPQPRRTSSDFPPTGRLQDRGVKKRDRTSQNGYRFQRVLVYHRVGTTGESYYPLFLTHRSMMLYSTGLTTTYKSIVGGSTLHAESALTPYFILHLLFLLIQASISVILILTYGYYLRKKDFIDQKTENVRPYCLFSSYLAESKDS